MTNKYCETFYNKCKDDLNLPNTYCDYHTGGADDNDQYWWTSTVRKATKLYGLAYVRHLRDTALGV